MSIRRTARRCVALIAAVILCFAAASPAFADDGTKSNVDIVFDFLRNELGFNSAAACGVLANIEKESGFIPTASGDGGTSYGICQWHDWGENEGLFTELKNFCDTNGFDWHTIEGQLNYLKNQLTTSSWYARMYTYMLQVPNTDAGAYDAGDYWCREFERPANKEAQGVLRGNIARDKYWPIYGDGTYTDERPYEIWKVGTTALNVRTGPDTTYPVATTLSPGTEVRVTGITRTGNVYWAKGPLGWSVVSGLDYVSGALYTVKYQTNCQTPLEGARVRFGENYGLASASALSKYGYTFIGWKVGGVTLGSGSFVVIEGDTVVNGLWQRVPSVTLIRGDANSDGKVNAKDVIAIMRSIIGAQVGLVPVAADVTCDLRINAKDVTQLMKFLVGAAFFEQRITPAEENAWN